MLYDVKPDLIIETGTNSGGCALYMAVLMEAINPDCKIFTIDTVREKATRSSLSKVKLMCYRVLRMDCASKTVQTGL